MSVVGRGVDRVDARAKVRGEAQYVGDVPVAGLVYGFVVTSTIAKGRVAHIDTSRAERAPGVLAVLTPWNAPRLPRANQKNQPVDKIIQVLQDPDVSYADQPIAVVVADTSERAREAGESLGVSYTPEPVRASLATDAARGHAPRSAGPQAKPDSARGDVTAGLAGAAVRVDRTYTTTNQHHHPMEMHGVTAVWQGQDALTVYDTSQGIFGCRSRLATIFELLVERVRVISHFVGGGFGCKGSLWSHVALAALAARVVARPVRIVLTRQQMCSLVGYRPRTIQQLSLGAAKDGTLVAVRHDVISETSRFDEFSEPSALVTRMLYACPNLATTHRVVPLDVPTPTFTRAPGEATGNFALEVALDELAHELGVDPLALRLKNYAERDFEEKKPWSSKSLRECYRRGAEAFGWSARNPAPASRRDGRLLVGFGMATAVYPARQSAASARAKLLRDGSIVIQAGSQDIGTGTYTILGQIAADVLGVPFERVSVELGDTTLPETPVSGGSQTASSTGSAVKRAAEALKRKLDLLTPAERAEGPELVADLRTEEKADRERYSTYGFGAQFVEVKVDPELGHVRVTRAVAAFAAGKILNVKTAHSQFMGGMVWGLGLALREHTVRDERSGRVVTRDLADYHVPVNADVPEFEIIMVEEEDPHVNEIGAKGIGEIGITGMPAAIANAVFNATGKRVRDLPITLDKVIA
ncbi:MAG TPA: xanthine dehydrogenase family protein molybdopterin-binding subunit [Polyangiaceae bacterium]|nr:xanthine dehydrogenase family protein molybdopterin-binding subunit [Polyangiaceae bacterium]